MFFIFCDPDSMDKILFKKCHTMNGQKCEARKVSWQEEMPTAVIVGMEAVKMELMDLVIIEIVEATMIWIIITIKILDHEWTH